MATGQLWRVKFFRLLPGVELGSCLWSPKPITATPTELSKTHINYKCAALNFALINVKLKAKLIFVDSTQFYNTISACRNPIYMHNFSSGPLGFFRSKTGQLFFSSNDFTIIALLIVFRPDPNLILVRWTSSSLTPFPLPNGLLMPIPRSNRNLKLDGKSEKKFNESVANSCGITKIYKFIKSDLNSRFSSSRHSNYPSLRLGSFESV